MAGGVVDVGEHRLAFHHQHEVLLAESGGEEDAVGADEQCLPGHLSHRLLHCALHGLLHVAQVHRLAQAQEEDGAHELENLHGLLGLPGGHQAQGVHVLVVLLRALHVRGHGVGQVVQLREVGSHGDLRAFHAVVKAGVGSSADVGRQPVVVVVVHELENCTARTCACRWLNRRHE